jgi:hypothetical protein
LHISVPGIANGRFDPVNTLIPRRSKLKTMYKHILVPVDAAARPSRRGLRAAIALAKTHACKAGESSYVVDAMPVFASLEA